MSTGFRNLRERLADSIAAKPAVELMREQIVVERQGDLFDKVTVAAQAAESGVVLVLGIAEGENRDASGHTALDFDLRITLSLMVDALVDPDAADVTPEESIFDVLCDHCHGLTIPGENPHCDWMFKVIGFGEVTDGDLRGYLVRQIVLSKRATLPKT